MTHAGSASWQAARTLATLAWLCLAGTGSGWAQPPSPAPKPAQAAKPFDRLDGPAFEDFETDADGDGVPDGWYNARDGRLEGKIGVLGPGALRFENALPGRPARMSRAFGLDGQAC
jgi:hypothetical protein